MFTCTSLSNTLFNRGFNKERDLVVLRVRQDTKALCMDTRPQSHRERQASRRSRDRCEFSTRTKPSPFLIILPLQIWRHLQPGQEGGADVFSELTSGTGQLRIRLEFDPSGPPLGRTSTSNSISNMPHMTSPSRFSLRAKKTED